MAKILVIDDQPDIREMIRSLLEDEGHEVIEAEDGNEGLRHCRADRPDLVITDIYMPERDGLETISDLRSDGTPIRIIAMSGGMRSGRVDGLAIAQRLGVDGVISKPFMPSRLLALIERTLEN